MEVQFILLAIYINPFHFCGLEKKNQSTSSSIEKRKKTLKSKRFIWMDLVVAEKKEWNFHHRANWNLVFVHHLSYPNINNSNIFSRGLSCSIRLSIHKI